jgi:hypothetical protein
LETFLLGLGTLDKFKIIKNEVSLSKKTIEKSITGTIGHKKNIYRDKRLKKIYTGTWTRKG